MDLYNSFFIWSWDNYYNNVILFIESLIMVSVIIIIIFYVLHLKIMKSFNYWIALELFISILSSLILLLLGFPSLKSFQFVEYTFNSFLSLDSFNWGCKNMPSELKMFWDTYSQQVSSLISSHKFKVVYVQEMSYFNNIIYSFKTLLGFEVGNIYCTEYIYGYNFSGHTTPLNKFSPSWDFYVKVNPTATENRSVTTFHPSLPSLSENVSFNQFIEMGEVSYVQNVQSYTAEQKLQAYNRLKFVNSSRLSQLGCWGRFWDNFKTLPPIENMTYEEIIKKIDSMPTPHAWQ